LGTAPGVTLKIAYESGVNASERSGLTSSQPNKRTKIGLAEGATVTMGRIDEPKRRALQKIIMSDCCKIIVS
jgi:hypothetical protein